MILILLTPSRIDIIDNELKKIITPQALTANFLHPLYRVYEFLIDELDDTGLQELECFKNSKGLFAKLITKTTCSKTFWSIASEQNPNLSMLAQSLLKIPACTIKFNQYDLGIGIIIKKLDCYIECLISIFTFYKHLNTKRLCTY
ncbi:Protein of unknown function [Cotesia congregata]|uniref:Uncharacterized protein n=1 Tax=Cotesia congregata TaxID=51543 RepID=A0A8J2MMZ3_COTCN|nr:Protein of unknown function [Cotesia congregata]